MRNVAFILFGLAPPATAQLLTNQGQLVTLTPNAVVTVRGGLTNAGLLVNNGSLAVSGNWTNQRTYQGRGVVNFDGAQPQQISHSPDARQTQAFAALRLTGGGEKNLLTHAQVDSSLALVAGLLTPADDQQLWLDGPVRVSDDNASSFVNGPLYVRNNRLDRIHLPIGRRGQYLPVDLSAIVAPGNWTMRIAARERDTKAPTVNLAGVKRVSNQRYWAVTWLSGTPPDALVTLPVLPDEGFTTLDSAIVLAANELSEAYRNLGQSAVTGNGQGGSVTSQPSTLATARFLALGVGAPSAEGQLLRLIYLPNALSLSAPNPDERAWKLYGGTWQPTGFAVRIYNRWGGLVYEGTSAAQLMRDGWDGRQADTGAAHLTGVYTYALRGTLVDGQPVQRVGTIQLLP